MNEKLKDKFDIIKNNKSLFISDKYYYLIGILYFIMLFLNKNIFVILLNFAVLYLFNIVEKNVSETQYEKHNFVYFALTSSLLNFVTLRITNNSFLAWFIITVILVELITFFTQKIFEKSKIFTFVFLSIFCVMQTLLFSLFFKQNLIIFLTFNIFTVLATVIEDVFFEKVEKLVLIQNKKCEKQFLKLYNYFSLIGFILFIYVIFGLIVL